MKSNRRTFIQQFGIGVTLAPPLIASSCTAPQAQHPTDQDEQVLFIGDEVAVADTEYGKVRGYLLRGIYHFLGVPYGADTSGNNRFKTPRKPEPWQGIRDTIWWGNSAPQIMEGRYANVHASFVDHWNYDDVSEDCLRLNIWTPAVNDGKKRPVMVWLHGGGFTNGNGIEQDGYKGENLSRKGDIVFCSLNHRLGPLGFTNLAGVGGEAFEASGNVGMLDIVAALEWIHRNITGFGGDPENVTIMGQSGGGAKVTTLTAMPAARGLFHKAVVLSGASTRSGDREYAEKLGSFVLREAGLKAGETDKLQGIPWLEYIRIANEASRKLREESGGDGYRGGFSPVVDGKHLPQHPYYPEATPLAADIPMIICSTFNEMSPSRNSPELEDISFDGVKEKLKEGFGFFRETIKDPGAAVDAYVKAFPDKKPVEIWSMIISNRRRTIELADAKSAQESPVYLAWFGWQPPLFNNRMRAFHCSDICFWYYNTDLMLTHTGGGIRPRRLSELMSDALLMFMRTGNPNGGDLPIWPRYNKDKGQTMILDDVPVVRNDPDREARKSLEPLS